MAEPFTLATIAAGCVWGLIGNRADAAVVVGGRKLAGVLAGTQTPQNHDVLRATHAAWLKSVQVMAGLAEGATTVWDDHASLKALKKAVRDPALTELRFDGGNFPQAELERLIGEIYRADADPDAVVVEMVIARIEAVMGEPLTDGLRAVFRTGHAGKRGWAATFQLFFSQAVKDDDAVFRILTFERLNKVIAFAAAQAEALAGLERDLRSFRAEMHDRFDSVATTQDVHTALLNQILANQGKGEQASIELLRALARGYAEDHRADDLEGLQSYLLTKIDQWREYRARIEELEAEGNRDAALLADAKAATDRGDFATADALLAEAVEALDEKIAPLLIAKSARIALRGENARVAGDYAAAMRFFDEAAAILPAQAAEERLARLWRAAETQLEWGERFGDPWLLPEAVRRWQDIAELCSRADNPSRWASTQNSLGNALATLGERESGTARLEEAVVAYRVALEEWTRRRVPLNWAATQNNLGIALRMLGARESGTGRLEEAVVAYRLALAVRTREIVPLNWATTQNNLGVALQTLGERKSGTARLEEAVIAYRLTLEEWTRERVPLDWAMTQNNLGIALATLGARESGTARLEEAVVAYRLALEERTRERVPLDWAATQNNLGIALQTLGELEPGTARLEEAVVAYRLALEVRTRERGQLNWAMTQSNLGNALRMVGERESGTARLEAAVAAYRLALEELTCERAPLHWAATQNNLGNALQTLGERESETGRLEEAAVAYGLALEERTHERVPLDWAGTSLSLHLTVAYLHERGGLSADLAALRIEAEAARTVLIEGGHEGWTPWANHVIAEIDRIIAAQPH